jgi:hypothetical protein
MGGGSCYLRAAEFVAASTATFFEDDDHVIDVVGCGVAGVYREAAVTTI